MKLSRISQVLSKFESEKVELPQLLDCSFFTFGVAEKYKIEIASDLNSKMEAYQLMYKLYSNPDINYAKEDSSKMWYSLFNASPYTKTIVVREISSKKIVATVTIVLDTKLGLPLEENYPTQIKNLRSKNRLCAEIISLGFVEEARGSSEILIQLFKFAYLIYHGVYGATDFLIMIKPRHSLFYEKILFFSAIGEQVNCFKINNKPVVLFHLDLEKAQAKAEKASNDEFSLKKDDCEEIFKSFLRAQNNNRIMQSLKVKTHHSEMTCEELDYFFVQKKNIFKEISPEKLNILSKLFKNNQSKIFIENSARLQNLNCILA